MKRYNPSDFEQKWQQRWEDEGTYTVDLSDTSKPKYIGFGMLPGITGAGIHIGHGRTYQFADIKVRAKRQQGFNAYAPIGWDSFGLPVENYAIKVGKTPRVAHDEAKENFIRQLKRLGYSYDWTKEISTADPSYYKWTQWIFTQLYRDGLAYQKESPQWWCETDQTVLANEQVEGGTCWRCHNPVSKRNLKQWFFKITDYADEMLEATDELNWTDSVKTMQKNWIGKSQGAEIDFAIDGREELLTVFSTRPDTLFGATFMVIAPEHSLAKSLANDDTRGAVEAYITEAARKSEIERMNDTREKTGVFSGSYAINPATGDRIPIWIADYVLAGYGTGAIMAVPAHDERDFAFAKKFNLPMKQVVAEHRVLGGVSAPRANVDTLRRKVVDAIIHDGAGNYLLEIEKSEDGDHVHFVGGGIELSDQTFEDAVRREILEEVGYTDIVSTRSISNTRSVVGYRHTKNKNQHVFGVFYEVVLASKNQVESEIDQGLHTIKWVSRNEVAEEITWPDHQAAWQQYLKESGHAVVLGEGILINSGSFDDMRTEEAREEVIAWLKQQGLGRPKTSYKMRDWLISRQRYWGAPIPIVHIKDHGAVAVPDDTLPVVLPELEDFKPKGGATSALASAEDWMHVWYNMTTGDTVPFSQGKPDGDEWREGHRETDTLDGYACSSWYFLRYMDPFNAEQAWSPEAAKHWGPVDFYNGADHAVAHLLYARFWMRYFFKKGWVSQPEPFKRMMYNAYIMAPDGRKMSKSLGNVIDPMEIMNSGYGADALRLYEMFIAPYDMEAPWDTRGVPGTYRFLNRVWNLVQEYIEASDDTASNTDAAREILQYAHKLAKKVTQDIEDEKFNTAVSSMMETVNAYYKLKTTAPIARNKEWTFALESLLMVMAPFAPHIAEELWYQLGHASSIHKDNWPVWDEHVFTSETVKVIVQVNGKLRGQLDVVTTADEAEVLKAAQEIETVKHTLAGKTVRRSVYVPGRIVNFVV